MPLESCSHPGMIDVAPETMSIMHGCVRFFRHVLRGRPDEESESTEWETDTDASDDEEADGEQVCIPPARLPSPPQPASLSFPDRVFRALGDHSTPVQYAMDPFEPRSCLGYSSLKSFRVP